MKRKSNTFFYVWTLIMALALGLLNAGVAHAEHLWQKIEYGMTPSEVVRAIPGSTLASEGAVELESFVFAEKKFRVRFLFRSNHLSQIHLSDTVSMEKNEITRRAFDKIIVALRRTYGVEAYNQVESKSSGLSGEAKWRKGDSEIVLTISPSTQEHSTILLNFFSRST